MKNDKIIIFFINGLAYYPHKLFTNMSSMFLEADKKNSDCFAIFFTDTDILLYDIW
jgi:hypothetical protein